MKKNLLVLTIVLLFVFAFNHNETFARKADNEKVIIDLEKSMAEALKNKKYDVFEKNFDKDYVGVYSYGFFSKVKELEAIKTVELKDYAISDVKVNFPDKNTAVIVYKIKVQGTFGDQDISGMYNVSSVWVNRRGKWLTVLHTEAKVDEET